MNIKKLIIVLMFLCVAQMALADSVVKTMYVDGVQVTQATVDGNGLTETAANILIGCEGNTGYMYNEYVGKMDEFAIYSGVLSATRIAAHYSASSSYTSYSSAVTADAPLMWLKFDDSSTTNGSTAANSGSVSISGSFVSTGTGAFSQTTGIATGSSCLVFPASEEDGAGSCVSISDAGGEFSTDLNGDVSIEVWVNYTIASGYPRFFQHNGSWDSYGNYGISVADSNQLVMIGGGVLNYASLASDINNGSWHHIVVTYDSNYEAAPETSSYTDEVSADSPVVWLRFESTEPEDSGSEGDNHWVGYGSAATIVDKVGGVGSSVMLDGSTGSGVYGVVVANGPNAPAAVGGTYEVFSDDYAFVDGDITFEMWYKTFPTGQTQPQTYAPFFQQIGNNEPCAPGATLCGTQIRVYGGSGASYTGISPKLDAEWHHLVVAYDERYSDDANKMTAYLYLDGALKKTCSFTGVRAVLGPEMSHLIIGAMNNIGYTYNAFAGYVDEFAIYSGVLSADRVAAHYTAWQPQDCADLVDRGYSSSADFNQDCKVNFADFATLAIDWMMCNDPEDENCSSNW